VAPPAPVGTRGTWAVVVGIDDYPGSDHDLIGAVNDAEDVVHALDRFGVGRDHILPLLGGQATKPALDAALGWLDAQAGPDAVAVFFFAGHAQKRSAETEALQLADGNFYTDARLASALANLRARRAWIAIASCFGGGFTEVLAPGRVLTGAAAADGIAYESTTWNRSELVEFMVRQAFIEGKADRSVQSAFAYARQQMMSTDGHEPVQYDQTDGTLDLRPDPSHAGAPPPDPSGDPVRAQPPGDQAGAQPGSQPPSADQPPSSAPPDQPATEPQPQPGPQPQPQPEPQPQPQPGGNGGDPSGPPTHPPGWPFLPRLS
jgi:hypothetical protein